ncbi:hypothetical protein [Parasediminibacterium sp. JCM 36343]|uniref:hypothetical protein n=1 Tax=Parasediminibacterium sp. JCM 36343 TaxID=3374279 RepID=UPI00397BB6D8
MLTEQEIKFIAYWETSGKTQRKSLKQFVKGLSSGLAIGAAILAVLVSGWYQRANMVANSKLSAVVLAIALISIAIFMAWIYQNYQWEMKEQQYLELIAKKKNQDTALDIDPPS